MLIPIYDEALCIDLSDVNTCLAGPTRPQDRSFLQDMPDNFQSFVDAQKPSKITSHKGEKSLKDGDVVIAAITSCTNTSNPDVMIGAALLAQAALAKGLISKPWVKTSLRLVQLS